MMQRPSMVSLALSLVLGALASLFTPGCSEDGQTPACPPLSLYDIGAAGERNSQQVADERAEAVAAKCMTDLGDASTSTP